MKKCITTLMQGGVSDRLAYHSTGRVLAYASFLDADIVPNGKIDKIHEYDVVYLYQKPENLALYDKMNLFGGLDEGNEKKFNNMIKHITSYKGVILQLDDPFLYATAYATRGLVLPSAFDSIPVHRLTDPMYAHLPAVIGDSHATSITPPKWRCLNKDGSTLAGVLKDNKLLDIVPKSASTVALYWGNIDARHHWCREDNPLQHVKDQANRYLELADMLPNAEVWLTQLLPQVEDSRKIPQTGFYKGTAFYGDIELRQECVYEFNRLLNYWPNVIVWDIPYYDESGYLNQLRMESGGSVHIAPHSYNREWLLPW